MIGSLLGLTGTACCGAKEYVDCFGLTRGLAFLPLAKAWPHPKAREVKIATRGRSDCVLVRPGTTDVAVFNTTYRSKQYDYDFAKSPEVIVDAGAYTGLSTAYFAGRYPDAKIIAIEPDGANFDLLVRNTLGLANVYALRAALWSNSSSVELTDPGKGEWAYRVVDMNKSGGVKPSLEEADRNLVLGITIPEIMSKYNLSYIDLLKLDIEGSEKEVLADSAPWITHVGAICIELHDRFKPGCSRTFYEAVKDFSTEFRRGETIMVMRN